MTKRIVRYLTTSGSTARRRSMNAGALNDAVNVVDDAAVVATIDDVDASSGRNSCSGFVVVVFVEDDVVPFTFALVVVDVVVVVVVVIGGGAKCDSDCELDDSESSGVRNALVDVIVVDGTQVGIASVDVDIGGGGGGTGCIVIDVSDGGGGRSMLFLS